MSIMYARFLSHVKVGELRKMEKEVCHSSCQMERERLSSPLGVVMTLPSHPKPSETPSSVSRLSLACTS